MGITRALRISPERARNRDQEDTVEGSRGPGHAYRMSVRGAIDDRKEVDRQSI